MGRRLLIVGATGLVGQGVLQIALRSATVQHIALLVRRPVPMADPRVALIRLDEFSAAALRGADFAGFEACLYCAGPLPLGMGEQAYRSVTVDLTRRVAQAYAEANPNGRILYVSGLGADAGSRLMPLKVKGEAEEALRSLGIPCTSLRPGIVRPVLGEASPHHLRRWAYRLGDPLLALGHRWAPGHFTTTRAIGEAMLRLLDLAQMPAVLENADINAASPMPPKR